jgi:flagellar hook-length control protein FliK
MSARVSSATSASTAASASSAVGGSRPAQSAGASAEGTAASSAAGAAAGARHSSAAGSGSNPAPGSGADAGASFSSVIADAVHGRDAKTPGAKAGGSSDDTDADSGNSAAGAAGNAPPTAASVTLRDLSTDAAPATSQNLAQSQPSTADQVGDVRAGRAAARPGGAARTTAKGTTSAVTTDPVVLAMLLAASGMQMSGGADANGAADATGSTPGSAAGDRDAAIAVSGDATGSAAVAQSAQSVPSAPSTQPEPGARDVTAQLPDARITAASTGSALSDAAALSAKSAAPAGQGDVVSIGTGAAGLPELVRSFTINGPQGAPVEVTIPVPVSSAGWPHAVAAQVNWFVSNDVQSATLRLSPDHLGPVEVHIDVQQTQVNVNFSAANAETRAALEQTVPRLREIFASGGLTLGQTNVQADPRSGSQATALPLRAALAHAQTVEPVAIAATHALGLVDEYA